MSDTKASVSEIYWKVQEILVKAQERTVTDGLIQEVLRVTGFYDSIQPNKNTQEEV